MTDWLILSGVVAIALAADLLLHRRRTALSLRTAVAWTVAWVALGLSFGAVVYMSQGGTALGEYYTGYVVEWSLSVDNVFVFAVLFTYFAVPREFQHRVLFWGVMGALVLRICFIFAGVAVLERIAWTTYTLGAFVIAAGVWTAFRRHEVDVSHHPVLRVVRRITPVTRRYHRDRFLVHASGGRAVTPLLVLLLVVATTDIVFAIDSIPAILAITSNSFVVVASNMFAVLGLRSLYFCVAGAMTRFEYLRFGLAAVLVFVRTKFLLADVLGTVPIWLSLGVIVGAVAASLVASEIGRRRQSRSAASPASRVASSLGK